MAKKKREEQAGPGSPLWLATFGDLMNLLLCFFVLLFAMSTVDQMKLDQVAISLSSVFGIFKVSSPSMIDDNGDLLNLGTSQLNALDELVQNMGQVTDETGEDVKQAVQSIVDAIEEGKMTAQEAVEGMNTEMTASMYDQIAEMIEEHNLDPFLTLMMDEEGGRFIQLNVDGGIMFDSGSAVISTDFFPILSKIYDVIRTFEGNMIEIIGHTDNVPIHTARYANNRELSVARALSVTDYLIDTRGMDPRTIKSSGQGEAVPVDTNSTPEGRQKNRRIEIRIYNKINS